MLPRITKLQTHLATHEALLLSRVADIQYFTGFTFLVPEEREALVLITADHAFLLHARFCPVKKVAGITNIIASQPSQVAYQLKEINSAHSFSTLYLDKASVYVDEYEALQTIENVRYAQLNPDWVWQVRSIKDTAEIDFLTQASTIASKSFKALMPQLVAGQTELEVQRLLEMEMIQHGSLQPAFPTIVAFGDHTALPHHQPTDRKLKKNTPVLIDFGATVEGYRSDMTRTFWFGDRPLPEFVKIEQIVKDAYTQTLARLTHSQTALSAKEVDAVARDIITRAGYGDYFIHTTGHGVGLDIHEQPSLNFKNETVLIPGMVITIEPGIYLEGTFGYRYENTVLISKKKVLELTA